MDPVTLLVLIVLGAAAVSTSASRDTVVEPASALLEPAPGAAALKVQPVVDPPDPWVRPQRPPVDDTPALAALPVAKPGASPGTALQGAATSVLAKQVTGALGGDAVGLISVPGALAGALAGRNGDPVISNPVGAVAGAAVGVVMAIGGAITSGDLTGESASKRAYDALPPGDRALVDRVSSGTASAGDVSALARLQASGALGGTGTKVVTDAEGNDVVIGGGVKLARGVLTTGDEL